VKLGGKWGKPRKNAYDDVGSSGDVIGFFGRAVVGELYGVFAGWPVTTMMTMMTMMPS
jgi:hypothetical protein